MIYHVGHSTTYTYTESVSLCHNLARLVPRNSPRQTCRRGKLVIRPTPAVTADRIDYFGNPVSFFTIQEPHRKLTVSTRHVVRVTPADSPDPPQTPAWESVRAELQIDRRPAGLEATEFTFDSPYVQAGADLLAYAGESFAPGRPLLEAVLHLTHRIHSDFRYDPKATTVATPLRDVFASRRGVCQDFAHLEIACLRSLGLAARYVSGYLCTTPPPGQERLVGSDASHAWVSVYCPGHGWVDFDPTNDQIPGGKHVLLGWGRDYGDVCPIQGVILGGGFHSVTVAVDVVPVEDTGG